MIVPPSPAPHRFVGLLFSSVVLVALLGCDEDGGDRAASPDTHTVHTDGGLPDADPVDMALDEALVPTDAVVGDGGIDAGRSCQVDTDCGAREWCDEHRICRPGATTRFAQPPQDGATRAGAHAFEIAPGAFEPWTDRAGPDCPDNRPGRFDGRLDTPVPDDRCSDGFQDLDGDGRFRAVWLGGAGPDRPATRMDDENPPAGRVVVLSRDDRLVVLITLDLAAVDVARLQTLTRGLSLRLGIEPGDVVLHTTGNRNGPDAFGLDGPTPRLISGAEGLSARARGELGLLGTLPARSGVDDLWWAEVTRRCALAATQAASQLRPVVMRAAQAALPLQQPEPFAGASAVPDANEDDIPNDQFDLDAWRTQPRLLARDDVLPGRIDETVEIVSLDHASTGAPAVVLLGWGAAPDVLPGPPILSAGAPGHARARIEAAHPGAVAVWLTTASADTALAAGREVHVPSIDADGRFIDPAGEVTEDPWAAERAESPQAALGQLVASRALAALADADRSAAELRVQTRFAWVPLTNPRFGLGAWLGILPLLSDWISGRATTNSWVSGAMTPACGGLGCIRYHLTRLDLGAMTLLTVPGSLSEGYVRGQAESWFYFGDQRHLTDLDGDGVPDTEDPDIRLETRLAGRALSVSLPEPVNPQRHDALIGLTRPGVWVIGRTHGGVGTFRPNGTQPNVFEGTHDPLLQFVRIPENASIRVCGEEYPCTSDLTLGALAQLAADALPAILANIPGGRELWIPGAMWAEHTVDDWRLEAADGEVRVVEAEPITVGPGDRVFAPRTNFTVAGARRGDRLWLGEVSFEVGGVVPITLLEHPNAADAWRSASPSGGDLVYNTACELLHDGACPHHRQVAGEDPNTTLPRRP